MLDIKKMILWPGTPRVLSLMLGLFLLFQWATTFLQMQYQSKLNSASSQPVIAQPKNLNTKQPLSSNLFGTYIPKQTIKQSMLNLKIVGIMLANQDAESKVILQTPSGRELSFKIGNTVPGGARIQQITAEGILLDYQGSLERLELPKLMGIK